MHSTSWRWILLLGSLFLLPLCAGAESLRPFVFAGIEEGDLQTVAAATRAKLRLAGFDVVGGYAPDRGRYVLVVTEPRLQRPVREHPRAAYGAVVRVGLTEVADGIQVAYTNPVYFQHAYRIPADFAPVRAGLAAALGAERTFGSRDGLTPERLARYHYAVGMEYFDDPYVLGAFPSQAAALAAIEQGLKERRGGVSKVYRLDLGPGVTLYGVQLRAGGQGDRYGDERFQLGVVDAGALKRTAYLPYEVLVHDGRVEALHMRFRMAVHFPDVNMVGRNSFMKLRRSPRAVAAALRALVGAPEPAQTRDGPLPGYTEDDS